MPADTVPKTPLVPCMHATSDLMGSAELDRHMFTVHFFGGTHPALALHPANDVGRNGYYG